ncbi:MAG: hypothetical protein ACT4OU_07515 [Hyphomicrobium sp.]
MSSAVRSLAPATAIAAPRLSSAADKAVGLSIAIVVPTAFWICIIAAAGSAAGAPFSAETLAATGGAIAAFLGLVCAPIMLRD